MNKLVRHAGLALALLASSVSLSPVVSSAQDLELRIGPNGVQVRERENADRDEDRSGRRCSPDRALDKAERMGVRRARIVDVDRRSIEVAGRRDGDRIWVTFARDRRCSVIDVDP